MANLMSLKSIRNNPSRDGFDLSSKRNFTAKVGELLPVWFKPVIPGDVFDIDLKSFTRTQPLNTAAYARMREYYDFFFVPLSQLWNKAPEVLTQMYSNQQHSVSFNYEDFLSYTGSLPFFPLRTPISFLESVKKSSNELGFDRAMCSAKLLEYLRYGDFYSYARGEKTWSGSPLAYDLEVNIFPLLAYQKIYSDFFRNTQWERAQPWTFNVDFLDGSSKVFVTSSEILASRSSMTFLDLRYCNYQKDLFHGMLPNAQYGSDVTVNAIGNPVGDSSFYHLSQSFSAGSSSGSLADVKYSTTVAPDGRLLAIDGQRQMAIQSIWNKGAIQIPVLALRQAQFLQKWKEIAQSADEDYKSQIQAHWGVSVSDYLSNRVRYLGGSNASLDINEVVNTNLVNGEQFNAADIAGKGIVQGNGHVRFESKGEYGIIMCIYHALPLLDYITTAPDPYNTIVDASSYPIPEFDKIGMEVLYSSHVSNPLRSDMPLNGKVFAYGYVPRYVSWKTDIDYSFGAFRNTLRSWVLNADDKMLLPSVGSYVSNNPNVPSVSDEQFIGYDYFKVRPQIMDSIFAVKADSSVDTDQLLCSSFFDVKVVRNLDSDGLPY